MGSHPANLFIRFVLEIIVLITLGIWGWGQSDNWLRFVLAFGIPILLAIIWAIFAVPNDPSRSGATPIVTNGIVRLLIEFTFFGIAIWALKDLGWTKLSLTMTLTVIIHYLVSYDRVLWLLSK